MPSPAMPAAPPPRRRPRGAPPGVPYALICPCGEAISGMRTWETQALLCPACSRPHLIFPASRLGQALLRPAELAVGPAPATGVRPPTPLKRPASRYWLAGLLASAAVAILGLALLLPRGAEPSAATPVTSSAAELSKEGNAAVAATDLFTAADRLRRAVERLERAPDSLPPADAEALRARERQVRLIADLNPEPLSDILRPLPGTPDAAWERLFRDRYAGKALLFDSVVRRDPAGEYHLDIEPEAGAGPVRLELQAVRLLNLLPLETPTRLLFGCRIAGARRGADGRWTLDLQPESGVLLTDPEMLRFLPLPPDDELRLAQKRMLDLPTGRVR